MLIIKCLRWLHRVDKTASAEKWKVDMLVHIPTAIASAAVAVLQPYCPGLSPETLIEALRNRNTETLIEALRNRNKPAPAASTIRKPLTRKQVAEILGVSLATVNRMMRRGALRAFKISLRSTRIDPKSVENLLAAPAAELEA